MKETIIKEFNLVSNEKVTSIDEITVILNREFKRYREDGYSRSDAFHMGVDDDFQGFPRKYFSCDGMTVYPNHFLQQLAS